MAIAILSFSDVRSKNDTTTQEVIRLVGDSVIESVIARTVVITTMDERAAKILDFPHALAPSIACSVRQKGSGEVFLNYSPVWPKNPFALFWQTPKIKFDHYWVIDGAWGQKIGEEKPLPEYYNWFFIAIALVVGPVVVRYLVVLCHDKWPKLLSFAFIVACSFLYAYLTIPEQYSNGYYGLYLSKWEVFSHYWMLGFPYAITISVGVLFWKLGSWAYNKAVRKQNDDFISHML